MQSSYGRGKCGICTFHQLSEHKFAKLEATEQMLTTENDTTVFYNSVISLIIFTTG